MKQVPTKDRIVILTHDVDWSIRGPGKTHVLARQNRFAEDIIQKVHTHNFNPYFGIPRIQEIEEKFGYRSTFFFRPIYDDGSEVSEYSCTISKLLAQGWEVGLHANDTSTLENVKKEKLLIEKAAGCEVIGCRIHCLKTVEDTYRNLSQAGIKYDSSISFDKQRIDQRNVGYQKKNGVTVFPITFMDAYLFTYMAQTEETIVSFIVNNAVSLFDQGAKILTLLWHDNAVMMKGGRVYPKLIEQFSEANVTFLTGKEAFKQIQEATRND